jgi:hypothetical protein
MSGFEVFRGESKMFFTSVNFAESWVLCAHVTGNFITHFSCHNLQRNYIRREVINFKPIALLNRPQHPNKDGFHWICCRCWPCLENYLRHQSRSLRVLTNRLLESGSRRGFTLLGRSTLNSHCSYVSNSTFMMRYNWSVLMRRLKTPPNDYHQCVKRSSDSIQPSIFEHFAYYIEFAEN